MPRLLDKTGNTIEHDLWQILPEDYAGGLINANQLAPLELWLKQRSGESGQQAPGVWLNSDDEPEALVGHYPELSCIGIRFATFMDGRGFSVARLIRERYGYQGELRAFGYIIPDQLFFLARCGFDTFLLDTTPAQDFNPQPYFNDFTVTYQSCVDQPQPLFRRRS